MRRLAILDSLGGGIKLFGEFSFLNSRSYLFKNITMSFDLIGVSPVLKEVPDCRSDENSWEWKKKYIIRGGIEFSINNKGYLGYILPVLRLVDHEQGPLGWDWDEMGVNNGYIAGDIETCSLIADYLDQMVESKEVHPFLRHWFLQKKLFVTEKDYEWFFECMSLLSSFLRNCGGSFKVC